LKAALRGWWRAELSEALLIQNDELAIIKKNKKKTQKIITLTIVRVILSNCL